MRKVHKVLDGINEENKQFMRFRRRQKNDKVVLNESVYENVPRFMWLRNGLVAGCYKLGNSHPGSIKHEKLLDETDTNQLLKNYTSCSMFANI